MPLACWKYVVFLMFQHFGGYGSIEESELFTLSIVGVGFAEFWADALARQ